MMSKRKSLLLKAGLLLSLLAVNVVAATPGSRCTIRARLILGIITLNISGRVAANGVTCRPLNIPPLLEALGTGVACGSVDTVPGVAYYTVTCPN
jgi:hypothetical protein